MLYPDTYYRRTLRDSRVRPAFTGTEEADMVIVGGGFAGLTTALELARAGQKVIVLEAESIGFGASGRNGGIVSPAFSAGDTAIRARVGPEAARDLHRLSIEGVKRLRTTITDLKIDGAMTGTGPHQPASLRPGG